MSNVISLEDVRAAAYIAAEFEAKFSFEIERAKKAGVKLLYSLDQEEQIGRGTLFFAKVRIVPIADGPKRKFRAQNATSIDARADYTEEGDALDAVKAAIDEAWTLGKDALVF